MADAMQIDRVLFISTSHIPKRTDEALVSEALHDLRFHGVTKGKSVGMPATMLLPCNEGFYGYMVWVDHGFVIMQAEDDHKELQRVIEFAAHHDCSWIRFDCNGPVIADLPTFDWEAA